MFYNNEIFSRFTMMLSQEQEKRLFDARVLVFGIGGVGGALAHMLVRSGIQKIGVVDFDLIDMQTFLPASKITEEESVKLLNQLYSKFDYAFDEPEFRYPEEPEYDDDGNPYWYCLCKVYRKEEKGGGYSKKVAKRRAAFKMLANLLSYKINENYDDGL